MIIIFFIISYACMHIHVHYIHLTKYLRNREMEIFHLKQLKENYVHNLNPLFLHLRHIRYDIYLF